ncbi:glycosyltransferase family 9 protein [Candidatus Dependentiae bacterium]|nr:glycosyltransferase family 9 protein [Candidatus Dependentiae bacterium]
MNETELLLNILAGILCENKEKPTGSTAIELEYTKADYSKIKKILIIQFSAFGDVIITNNLLDTLKNRFETHILTLKNNSGIVSEKINKIELDQNILLTGNKNLIITLFKKLVDIINSLNFDLIINLHPSEYSAVLSSCLISHYFLGQKFDPVNKKITAYFDLSFYLKYFIKYYSQITDNFYNIPLADMYRLFSQSLKTLLNVNSIVQASDKNKNIVICPGGKWDSKLWNPKNFAELINLISDNFGEFTYLITGDVSEKKMIEQIYVLCKYKNRITLNAGDIELRELKKIISESAFTITNDTAILHLSNYLNTPSIVLISSTITIPFGDNFIIVADKNCSGCMEKKCPKKNDCINKISCVTVFNLVRDYINSGFSILETSKKYAWCENQMFPNKIYYTLKNDDFPLRFQYPVSIEQANENSLLNDLLFFSGTIAVIGNNYLTDENKKIISESLSKRIITIYKNYSLKKTAIINAAENITADLSFIKIRINKIFKQSIRINGDTLKDFYKIYHSEESELSKKKIYNIFIKPYDILLYEFSNKHPENLFSKENKKYLEKIKLSVKIKKTAVENLDFILIWF